MVQIRIPGRGFGSSGVPSGATPRAPRAVKVHAVPCTAAEDLSDRLGSITDREDLERLFARSVAMPQILQLMGRQISREQIHDLLESATLEEDLRKLLD